MNIQQRNLELGKRLARVRNIYRRPPQRAILYSEKPTVYQTTPLSALTRAYDAEKPAQAQKRSNVYPLDMDLFDVLDRTTAQIVSAGQSKTSIEADHLGIPYITTGYIEGRAI